MKNIKKFILLSIWIIIFFVPSIVFWQWWESNETALKILNSFITLMSWFWMIPATVAWVLMTNQFVYWEVIHLDQYLWQIWNMTKTFANFVIWFLFIFVIFKTFFKWEPWSVLKSYLPKIFLWWVLVQASWFIIAALIDISIIAMMAVSTIPNYFIEKPQNSWISITMPTECNFNTNISDITNIESYCGPGEQEFDFLDFAASPINASGPLYYFWFSVLWLQTFTEANIQWWKEISISLFLKLFVALMFTIPVTILLIINFIRIFWLWMFVVFSPLIFLDFVFWNKVSSKIEWAWKKLTFANFIWLAFQPVVVIWMLSLIMIFVVWLERVFKIDSDIWATENQQALQETLNVYQPTAWGWWVRLWETWWVIEIQWEFLPKASEYIWWTIWYLMISIFVWFMVWSLIKVSFKTSEITSWVAQTMFNFSEEMMKTVPVVPWTSISVWALQRAQRSLWWEIFQSKQRTDAARIEWAINKLYWADGISSREHWILMNRINQFNWNDPTWAKVFFDELRRFDWPLIPASDGKLRQAIEDWTKKYANWVLNEQDRKQLLRDDWTVNRESAKFKWLLAHMMSWNIAPNRSTFNTDIVWTTQTDVYNTDLSNLRR